MQGTQLMKLIKCTEVCMLALLMFMEGNSGLFCTSGVYHEPM